MQPAQWKTFIAQFAGLNRRQRLAGITLLRGAASQDVIVALVESVARQRLHCPACNSNHAHRHGHAHGLQRYRCAPCGRTFNALTGTPLARLRHKSLWLDYADCLLASDSVRKAASQLGVHRNTTFRWRHRFLSLAKTDRPHGLHGIAEADELYLLESEKGARQMTRPARRRGGHAHKRGISNEQVCILVARDRTGQTLDFVTGKGALTKAQLHHCLLPVIDKDVLLVTDGHAAYRPLPGKRVSATRPSTCAPASACRAPLTCRTSTPITAACGNGYGRFTAWRRATCRITWAGAGYSTPGASARLKRY